MDRVRRLKLVLWSVTGIAAAVGITRFVYGLGATTNLTDGYAWGFWIGFDVMGGVALAAGGFVITALVYIFRRDEFHPIVKPAVLTAFLGYVAVIIGLLFDLGLPWNIWHMMIYWNPHSPLFEVGWCVMLYTTVLLLEFSPVPLEPFSAWAKIRRFLIRFRLLFVLLGISLSTLHQSSLGSLFLIMPYRVHPLWYSPILPILFFVSAVLLGLMMVCWESMFTAYMYRRTKERNLVARLLGASRWVILLYLVLRFGDLAVRGQLGHLFESGWRTWLFWVEISVMCLLPFILASIRRVRFSDAGQWIIANLGVFGVVLNRTDVGGLTHLAEPGARYFPSWTEFAVSAGVVSVVALVFLFMVEHFRVWEERAADPDADPKKLPEFDRASGVTLGEPGIAGVIRNSLAFIFTMAFGFMLLSGGRVSGKGTTPVSVSPARGGDTLWVDGNLDGYGVAFPHKIHEQKNGEKESCAKCHHMNFPRDKQTVCADCHRFMYTSSDAFRHDWHGSSRGAKLACVSCHPRGELKTAETVPEDIRNCSRCHDDLFPEGVRIKIEKFEAAGYADAMHGLCIGCHQEVARKKAEEAKQNPAENETLADGTPFRDLTRCTVCHKGALRTFAKGDSTVRLEGLVGRWVVLPGIELQQQDTP